MNKKRFYKEFLYLAMYDPLKFWLLFTNCNHTAFVNLFMKCKSAMILCFVYYVSICPIAVDFVHYFFQDLILSNEGKIRQPQYFVFNFHALKLFFFFKNFLFNVSSFIPVKLKCVLLEFLSLLYNFIYLHHEIFDINKVMWF